MTTGIVLEEAERAIKTVIAEDNLLPIHCRGLSPEQWGIELADYFECVSGERPACSNSNSASQGCSALQLLLVHLTTMPIVDNVQSHMPITTA